MTMFSDSET